MSTISTKPSGKKTMSSLQMSDEGRLLLKKRRTWYYLAVGLFVGSFLAHAPLLLLAGFFTLLVAAVPDIWYIYALRHLIIRQSVSQSHLFFGERVTLSLSIENRKLLPLPSLQIEDTITPALEVVKEKSLSLRTGQSDMLASTWLLWSYQRVTRRYSMRCQSRGFHVFGPVKLYCSDPFGWLERQLYVAANEIILVYPLIASIEELGLPPVLPMGDSIGRHKLFEDPLWFAGIREYEIGDDPRRIDWKATARAGELRSKIYESTTVRRLLIVLNTQTYTSKLNGVDLELQEFCISVAASLAIWGLDSGYMVGLLANSAMVTTTYALSTEGNTDLVKDPTTANKSNATTFSEPIVSVPCSLEYGQYEQILTTLARLLPQYGTPIERVFEEELQLLSPGTTIVLVSSENTLGQQTIDLLQERRRHGNAITLVLMGDVDTEKEPPEHTLPVYHVGGKEKWRELIRTVGEANDASVGANATFLKLG